MNYDALANRKLMDYRVECTSIILVEETLGKRISVELEHVMETQYVDVRTSNYLRIVLCHTDVVK